jgi:hypothetical protein
MFVKNPNQKQMSERQKPIYAKGIYLTEKAAGGKEMIEISFNVDNFTQFLQEHKNERGYVKISCWPKGIPDNFGSHNCTLNTWKPKVAGQPLSSATGKDDLPF